jgi:hypothetical protein
MSPDRGDVRDGGLCDLLEQDGDDLEALLESESLDIDALLDRGDDVRDLLEQDGDEVAVDKGGNRGDE